MNQNIICSTFLETDFIYYFKEKNYYPVNSYYPFCQHTILERTGMMFVDFGFIPVSTDVIPEICELSAYFHRARESTMLSVYMG